MSQTATDACLKLGPGSAFVAALGALPWRPGLYSLTAKDADAIEQLGLDELEPDWPLAARVLYLGKSETSLAARLEDTHFATGKTGHSTVRRTFGALLELSAIPRPAPGDRPTRRQQMTATANFALSAADERRLTQWMLAHLEMRVYPISTAPLKDLEREVGGRLKPPLDQERVPFWEPNPWREPVARAREKIRTRLRHDLGLVN